ncbi:MAG: prepilin-type N-terminal cleavage/methylation domain-containing protein [Phycisphaerales bacterium]
MRRTAFTIIELLVVIAIIVVLVAITVPVYSSIRGYARATGSLSNLRQWGAGLMQFAFDQKGRLPWEGYKNANQMPANFAQELWWANAVPPYVGQPPYSEVSNAAAADPSALPMPPTTNSIFIDPSAQVPSNAPYSGGGKKFFFCYVPNAQLDETLENKLAAQGNTDPFAVRVALSSIPKPVSTVVMLEMRTVKDELPKDDPYYNEDLKRHFADWQRFAARHRHGGHMVFADGHAAHVDNVYATTNSTGSRADGPGFDMNKSDLVWDPLGPAFND